MSHWNYRVMRKVTSEAGVGLEDSVEYGIHEVYYDDDDAVTYWTRHPIEVVAVSPEGLTEELARMAIAVATRPVLSAETGEPVDE